MASKTFTVPARRSLSALRLIDPIDGRVDELTGLPLPGVGDSSAGLQAFINSTPRGSTIVLPFDLKCDAGNVLTGDRILQSEKPARDRQRLYAPNPYPWRVVPDLRKTVGGKKNPYYNPLGVCAPWAYDITGSIKNPYGRPDNREATFGGFDGMTGASGVDYDGTHLSTRLTTPFRPEHEGKVIRPLIDKVRGVGFNVPISKVDEDGKTVYWVDRLGVAMHEDSTHNVAWCIEPKLGWAVVFTANPAWNPTYYGGYWHGYDRALKKCFVNNWGRTNLQVRDTSKVIGIDVIGANPLWQMGIWQYAQSAPMVNEFQHGIDLQDPGTVAYLCHAHHVFGDGFYGPGETLACRADRCGRSGIGAHWDGKLIDGCVVELTKLAAINAETEDAVHNLTVKNVTLGGRHGLSISSPLVNALFQNIHSTKEDVARGTVGSLAQFMRGKAHCGEGSSNVTYDGIRFDKRTDDLIVVRNVDGLTVKNCQGNLSGHVVRPYTRPDRADLCKNLDVSDNDGGKDSPGEVAT